MMERICRVMLISGTILWFVVLLCGCTTVLKETDPKESLKSIALTYWKMRIEGNYKDALKMEEKEQLTKGNTTKLPLDEYYKAKAEITSKIDSYSINDVKILNDRGRVDVEFVFTLPQIPKPVHQKLSDEWILKDGKWLHLFP